MPLQWGFIPSQSDDNPAVCVIESLLGPAPVDAASDLEKVSGLKPAKGSTAASGVLLLIISGIHYLPMGVI